MHQIGVRTGVACEKESRSDSDPILSSCEKEYDILVDLCIFNPDRVHHLTLAAFYSFYAAF